MASLDTIETEVDRLSDLCARSRCLVSAGHSIDSALIAELEAEASIVIGGIVAQLDSVRVAELEREAELARLLAEHEAAALLLCQGIPPARRAKLADLVSARAVARAGAVLAPTGR